MLLAKTHWRIKIRRISKNDQSFHPRYLLPIKFFLWYLAGERKYLEHLLLSDSFLWRRFFWGKMTAFKHFYSIQNWLFVLAESLRHLDGGGPVVPRVGLPEAVLRLLQPDIGVTDKVTIFFAESNRFLATRCESNSGLMKSHLED